MKTIFVGSKEEYKRFVSAIRKAISNGELSEFGQCRLEHIEEIINQNHPSTNIVININYN